MRKKQIEQTMQEVSADIGKMFIHKLNGLNVEVKVNDVKFAYGTKRYLVSVAGQESNQVWIFAPTKPDWTG